MAVRLPQVRDTEDLYQRDARGAIKQLDAASPTKSTVRGVSLGVATVKVPHQLGKIPTSWVVIDKTATADIWRDTTVPSTADFIALKASATVQVDIQFWAQA